MKFLRWKRVVWSLTHWALRLRGALRSSQERALGGSRKGTASRAGGQKRIVAYFLVIGACRGTVLHSRCTTAARRTFRAIISRFRRDARRWFVTSERDHEISRTVATFVELQRQALATHGVLVQWKETDGIFHLFCSTFHRQAERSDGEARQKTLNLS